MRTFRVFLIAAACCLALPTLAKAQASISGVIKDASGAVLPGVTVEAASPALIEKTREVVTDGSGQYRIVDLRPGEYTVTFTLSGFSTVKREGITLQGTMTATVNADLRVGAVEETITVTGATPLVDVQSVQQQRVLNKDVIDTLPTGRTTTNLAVLVPGMVLSTTFSGESQDVGGNTGDVMQAVSIHGGRGDDLRRMVDGLSMQSFGPNSSAFSPNSGMVQEVVVDVAAGSAEQSTGGVRINIIPRDGGNAFTGSFYASGTSDRFQSDNVDQTLRDRRFISASTVRSNFEVNPTFGGPIKRDRLWFFASGRVSEVNNYMAGALRNANAGNASVFAYVPDPSFRGSRDSRWRSVNGRLTWQANQKNKVSVFTDVQNRCSCIDMRALTSPEASANFEFPTKRLVTVTYTAPLTSRILVDAGFAHKPEDWGYFEPEGGNDAAALVGVNDLASGIFYRGPRGYFGTSMRFRSELMDNSWRGSVSYVTGAHAVKVGYQDHLGRMHNFYNVPVAGDLSYTFNAGSPVQITQRSPYEAETHVHDGGIYAQDRWTISRLTANLGVRYDFYRTSYPTQTLGPNAFTPNRNVTFQGGKVASFNDVTPKLGVAYDLFGTGKTALKASLSKYVQQMSYGGTFGETATPPLRTVQSVTRTWTDRNSNFIPDCDLLNLQLNGECDIVNNLAYGNPIPSTTYDPATLSGWGKRGYNWETSVGIQQELMPNVSADVGYFRRWYGNFLVTDNLNLAATDFTQFSVAAPGDSRLPGGGGQRVTSLYNVTTAGLVRPPNNLLTFAKNYGDQAENWQGIDASINARLRGGVLTQGGISTGRTLTDSCEIRAAVPESAVLNPYCRVVTPYLTQFKLLGSYTIPRVDVLFSGAFQSIPGPQVVGNNVYTSAQIEPSLGRPLAGTAVAQINIVTPGSMYGDRLNQLDFRVGKIVRYRGFRSSLNVDLYNVFNDNAVLTENGSFALFRQPLLVLNPRIVKFSVNFDF